MELTDYDIKQIKCELASVSFHDFCKIADSESFYNEDDAPYLKEICDALQEFETDDNEAIIITEPPRHGKTRTTRS